MEQQEVKTSPVNKSLTIMGIFVNHSSNFCLLVHGLSGDRSYPVWFREPLTPGTVTGQSLPAHTASKWTEVLWIPKLPSLCGRTGLRHSHLSNPSNQGRHDQMVLLEGTRKKKKGRMPTNLNQTQVNQLAGDGEVTIFLVYFPVS